MKKPLVCSGRGSRQPVRSRTQIEPPKRELGGERLVRPCLPGAKGSKFRPEFLQREGGLATSVLADRERLVGLLVPIDDRHRDFLPLAIPYSLAAGVARAVDLVPEPLQLGRELPGRV